MTVVVGLSKCHYPLAIFFNRILTWPQTRDGGVIKVQHSIFYKGKLSRRRMVSLAAAGNLIAIPGQVKSTQNR